MFPKCGSKFGNVSCFVAIITGLFPLAVIAQMRAPIQAQTEYGATHLSSSSTSLFLPPVSYATGGSYSVSVAVADLNGDGKLDAVVANANSGTVAVLLGDGRGGFGSPVAYSSGTMPWSVAVADLNGDGRPDIAVANYAVRDCGVSVLLGNGDGTFNPAVKYGSSSVCEAMSIVIADLNGDGKLDLAVATYRNIAILLGNNDGSFQIPVTYSWGNGDGTGWGPDSLKVADLNGDDKPDLAVASGYQFFWNSGKSAVGVLLGNGDGTFQPAVDYDSGGYYAFSLATTDVNLDGKPDIVVANNCAGISNCPKPESVGVLLGNGDGTFQAAVTYGQGILQPVSVALVDVNADGKIDIVVANECASDCSAGSAGVLLGNGDGTFQAPLSFTTRSYAFMVAASDLNRDSQPDLVIAHLIGSGSISVLLNNTSCTTAPIVTLSIFPTTLWPANGKIIPVTVAGTITDTAGCTLSSATYAVTDEYGKVQPRGPINVDAAGAYSFVVPLEASRLGSDLDGRHYSVNVSVSNNAKRTASQTGIVIVAHDQRH